MIYLLIAALGPSLFRYYTNLTFLQAFLISFAPLYLSFWLFFFLLDYLIHNQVSALVFFLCFFTMISISLSAAPSVTDLAMIPKAIQNDSKHSLYQLLLIFFPILTTCFIFFVYNIQFIHEFFIYLVIALTQLGKINIDQV